MPLEFVAIGMILVTELTNIIYVMIRFYSIYMRLYYGYHLFYW